MDGIAETDIAYLAGFFDGEGCISMGVVKNPGGRRYHLMAVFVTNSNYAVLNHLRERFGGRLDQLLAPGKNPNWLPQWRLVWPASKHTEILETLLPLLIVKRRQAELGLQFRQTVTRGKGLKRARVFEVIEERNRIHAELVLLNGGGRIEKVNGHGVAASHLLVGDETVALPTPKEFCAQGHALTDDNIRGGKQSARRRCATCHRERQRTARERRQTG
jgi:hypothetical protein